MWIDTFFQCRAKTAFVERELLLCLRDAAGISFKGLSYELA
jgi:hypothetical protein